MRYVVIKTKMSNIQFLISKKNKRQKGFTLIELLVVITIMGVLTVITVSSFRGTQVKSRDARRKNDLESINKAVNMYYNDNNLFPDANFNTLLGSGGEFKTSVGGNNIIYMKELPKEKSSSVESYVYEVSSTRKSFKVFTNLENTDDSSCIKNNGQNMTSLDTYSIDGGCIYGVSSSNIGVTTPVESML